MNDLSDILPAIGPDTTAGVTKLAIMAVGGQGGGVLTNWITEVAQAGGYRAQATSVAGVAQRTGATIYYIEMAPRTDRLPVFALAPSTGDVDILIAAELMEAGRAMMRGFVSADKTTLIASTHRVLAVDEKIVPGDGRADASAVMAQAEEQALNTLWHDYDAAATGARSVISASLFGALAASGTLPFDRSLYEQVIRESGRGVEASLAAFAAGFDGTHAGVDVSDPAPDIPAGLATPEGPAELLGGWRALEGRVAALPEAARPMALRGLAKVVDYQDVAYGSTYLDYLERARDKGDAFITEAAKYLANAMCYDDLIRVADLKTRASRETRLRGEQGADPEAIVHVTEYFHPRAEEVVGAFPAGLGGFIERRRWMMRGLDWLVNRGRRLRTDGLRGWLSLWVASGLKPFRCRMLRHKVEVEHLERWFALALAQTDAALGVEVLRCRRLIKGYSDTHARGLSKYDRVIGALPTLNGREDAPAWLRRLRDAALQDEHGEALDGALKTIESF